MAFADKWRHGKFKQAAREIDRVTDEAHWEERLKKIGNAQWNMLSGIGTGS